MPYYDMKCRLCGGYVGKQFFDEENIPENDPRMIGPGLCGHHEDSEPILSPISAYSPDHGPVGTLVSLPGRTIDTLVYFNNVEATNAHIEDNCLLVEVPNGATTGDLQIKPPGMDIGPLGSFTVEE